MYAAFLSCFGIYARDDCFLIKYLYVFFIYRLDFYLKSEASRETLPVSVYRSASFPGSLKIESDRKQAMVFIIPDVFGVL